MGSDAMLALPEGERKMKHLEGHGTDVLIPASEATGDVYKRQDMDILFDIIDTLLAQKEFDEAGCTDPQTDEDDDTTDENNDEGDDTDNQDSDDDAIPTATPADYTKGEVLNADSIDAIIRQRVKIGMILSLIRI